MADSSSASHLRASLYVGDLHPTVDESKLHEVFSEIGDLSSVKICRDMLTGNSLCIGYVNFIREEDAALAIKELDNTPLKGKFMSVLWAKRNTISRRNDAGNLFVKYLDESIDNAMLYDIFSKYGKVLSCKVARNLDAKSRGYGFVQFDSAESANKAIEHANGSNIEGKAINLDRNLTEDILEERFSQFGIIKSLVILRDRNGSSNGVGFVNYDNSDDAKHAMEVMNETQLGSRTIYVNWAQKKQDREKMPSQLFGTSFEVKMKKREGFGIYIKNINVDATDNELQALFSQCGRIRSLKIVRDDEGRSRGFGFIRFSTPEEVRTAVYGLNGYMFRRRPIYVVIAERKADRLANWQLQYSQKLAAIALAQAAAASYNSTEDGAYYRSSAGIVSELSPRQGLMHQRQPLESSRHL